MRGEYCDGPFCDTAAGEFSGWSLPLNGPNEKWMETYFAWDVSLQDISRFGIDLFLFNSLRCAAVIPRRALLVFSGSLSMPLCGYGTVRSAAAIAAAAAAAGIGRSAAAAAQQNDNQDDPQTVTTAKAIVAPHMKYLPVQDRNLSSAAGHIHRPLRSHTILCRKRKKVRSFYSSSNAPVYS